MHNTSEADLGGQHGTDAPSYAINTNARGCCRPADSPDCWEVLGDGGEQCEAAPGQESRGGQDGGRRGPADK
eukprot:2451882-Alexandrium_andersonii.AAC.1